MDAVGHNQLVLVSMTDEFAGEKFGYGGTQTLGGALSAVRKQCKRNATIWACGGTRDPYFVIPGGYHCCLKVGFDTSSTLGTWHFWVFA